MPWSNSEYDEVLSALAVVSEVTGAMFTTPAKQFLIRELESYPAVEVLQSLRRCAREVTHKLALAHVIERIEEQREKDKASRRARAEIEESKLRALALEKRIPWELGKEKVRELLTGALALPAPDPAKEAARARSLAKAHWSETDPEEP
jgi:hypothetical protein